MLRSNNGSDYSKDIVKSDLFHIYLDNIHNYNYADVEIEGSDWNSGFQLDIFGSFNQTNATNMASFSIGRVNNYASVECLKNTMEDPLFFIGLPKRISFTTHIIRIWFIDYIEDIKFYAQIKKSVWENNNDNLYPFYIKGVSYGRVENSNIIPMIEGDRVSGWIISDSDTVNERYKINESNVQSISWHTSNKGYKKYTSLAALGYSQYDWCIEYENYIEISMFVDVTKDATTYLKFPVTGVYEYNVWLTLIGQHSLNSVSYSYDDNGFKIYYAGAGASTSKCDVLIRGKYKNPRFKAINPNMIQWPNTTLLTEKKLQNKYIHNIYSISNLYKNIKKEVESYMLRSVNNFNENKFVKRNYMLPNGISNVINCNILPGDVTISIPDHVSVNCLLCKVYLRNQTLDAYIHTKFTVNFNKNNPDHWFVLNDGYVYGIIFKLTDTYSLNNIRTLINNSPDGSFEKRNRCIPFTAISRNQLTERVSTFIQLITENGEYCVSVGMKESYGESFNVDTWTWSFGDYFMLPNINSVEKKLHNFYLLNNIISSPLYKYNKGGVIIC